MYSKIYLLILLVIAFSRIEAQTPSLSLTPFATGFSNITSVASTNDDRLFVVQQRGRIRIVDINTQQVNATDYLNISSRVSSSGSETGLLGMAFHPQYAENGYFFLYYTAASGGATVVARYRVSETDPNVADPNSEQILLTFSQPQANHNGGCIEFGKDGYLYIASGDGGGGGDLSNFAQNNLSYLGKMLRIDVNNFGTTYNVPASNPFVGNAAYRPEIWATGLRNPWRFSFDRMTGDMWIGDVGQNAIEEINFQPFSSAGGENYGWRCYEGNNAFNLNGCQAISNYTFPVFFYNQASNGCSVTGGYVYRGPLSEYMYGRYFFTDYCTGRIWSLKADGSENYAAIVHGNYTTFNYVAFGEDRYGELYLAERSRIMKFTVETCTPVARISAQGSATICEGETSSISTDYHPELGYQWFKDGDAIDGATDFTYVITEPGDYQVLVTRGLCDNTSELVSITFAPQVDLTFNIIEEDFCLDHSIVNLAANPAGGTFSGSGVVGETFSPNLAGLGSHVITYSYTEAGFCDSQISDSVFVNALPNVQIQGLSAIYCVNAPEVNLQGLPAGGSFSANAENGIFNPSANGVGNYLITYTYADENGCIATASDSTIVDECLYIAQQDLTFSIYPVPANEQLIVQFDKLPQEAVLFEIIDFTGNKIEAELQAMQGKYILNLPKTMLSGVYVLRISSGNKTFVKSFVVSR